MPLHAVRAPIPMLTFPPPSAQWRTTSKYGSDGRVRLAAAPILRADHAGRGGGAHRHVAGSGRAAADEGQEPAVSGGAHHAPDLPRRSGGIRLGPVLAASSVGVQHHEGLTASPMQHRSSLRGQQSVDMLTNWKDRVAISCPRLWLALYRHYGYRRFARPRDLAVAKDSDLCLEGYPRSGNTFAAVAFEMSQSTPQRIAHHLHSPAQILQAVKWRIPTVVLVRDPHDAVVSLAVYRGSARAVGRLPELLSRWIYFYKAIEELRSSYVLATFEDVTTDFGRVVRRINERFGTDFGVFEHTVENTQRVLDNITALKGPRRRGVLNEGQVARPSEERNVLKARVSTALFDDDHNKRLLAAARSIYQRLLVHNR